MQKSSRATRRLMAAAAVVVTVAVGGMTTARIVSDAGHPSACAYFDTSFGVYPGSPVTIRGITVGSVREVAPDGSRVRVDMDLGGRRLPAETGAVITNASILTDRRVELVDADPHPGPALSPTECIDTSRTRTPVSVSDALGSFSDLVREATAPGPDGTAPLESVLSDAGREVDGVGPTLNRELRALTDLLSSPDNFMDQLGRLLDNSAEASTFVTDEWDDIKVTLQTFAPGLNGIQQMLVVAKVLVEKLSLAVGPLDRLFNEHFPYLMDALESSLPAVTTMRMRAEHSSELLATIPGVVQMLQTTVDSHPGSLALAFDPPRGEVATPDARLVCDALRRVAPDSCTVLSERSVAVPLPQLVLTTIGAAP